MLDWVPKLFTFVVVVALFGTKDESVLTGTGISCPDAMIAFLLLLVKTTGRLTTRNRPVESSAFTIAARPSRALLRRIVDPPPVPSAAATSVKRNKFAGSTMFAAVLRAAPAKVVSPVVRSRTLPLASV